MDFPTTCDVCGNGDEDGLYQHCHMSTGRHLGRCHFLCSECIKEFPVPTDQELRESGVVPDSELDKPEIVDAIANQIGAGYGARLIDEIDDCEILDDLPRRLFLWLEQHLPEAIESGWPKEEQIITALIGLGHSNGKAR
jgi:hypothetical protein